jgi:hypothetical protein
MTKYLLGALVGVFAGAFVLELLDRREFDLLGRLRAKAKRTRSDFRRAFVEGYQGVTPVNGSAPTTH